MKMVSRELILELQMILKEEFGLDLPYTKAANIGNFLLKYFEVLLLIEANKNKKKKSIWQTEEC